MEQQPFHRPGRAASRGLFLALCCSAGLPGLAQQEERPKLTTAPIRTVEHRYKVTPQGELLLHGYLPEGWKAEDRRPVILFFFGGAWLTGSHRQFAPQAEYFASRGIVGLVADYRVGNQHKTTPDRCVEDARSAMRWVRSHARELGIDPDRIIASGGSAGGHLAAATALLPGFDDPADDRSISCRPNALVLFNPALNLTGRETPVQDEAGKDISHDFSPTLFLKKDAPPTILFYGTADRILSQGQEFLARSRALGNRVELHLAPDMPHAFFNRPPWLQSTTRKADEFLSALGYLTGPPALAPVTEAALKKAE
ncbi:MAG: alpha/beta hydrolase [Armatimonadetes bacterium]|nr:alpha/beta hydrolase [Armatimonadota bacterium]